MREVFPSFPWSAFKKTKCAKNAILLITPHDVTNDYLININHISPCVCPHHKMQRI